MEDTTVPRYNMVKKQPYLERQTTNILPDTHLATN